MKYSCELEIKKSCEKVIELFDNSDNMKKWQPGLVSFEHISGEAGQQGAKSKLKYKMGKREVEMIETITNNNLPDDFSGTYEAKGVFNRISNKFIATSENQTKWISENEFNFKGFMKVFALFMPRAFKKQTCKYMEQFKDFAENE